MAKLKRRLAKKKVTVPVTPAPASALQRPNFFDGQLLSADDLRAEQEYFLARARRHNRFLEGWGVISGLPVRVASATQIVVGAGLAIDCAGNEIHVPTPATLSIKPSATPQFVVLQYTESLTRPVPGFESDAAPTYTRVREGFRLSLAADDPAASHGVKIGAPGCGKAHALSIASVALSHGRCVVKKLNRRRVAKN